MRNTSRIGWNKRDLRITGHAPLVAAARANAPGIPLYVIELAYWQRPFASRRHWRQIHDSLVDLNAAVT